MWGLILGLPLNPLWLPVYLHACIAWQVVMVLFQVIFLKSRCGDLRLCLWGVGSKATLCAPLVCMSDICEGHVLVVVCMFMLMHAHAPRRFLTMSIWSSVHGMYVHGRQDCLCLTRCISLFPYTSASLTSCAALMVHVCSHNTFMACMDIGSLSKSVNLFWGVDVVKSQRLQLPCLFWGGGYGGPICVTSWLHACGAHWPLRSV